MKKRYYPLFLFFWTIHLFGQSAPGVSLDRATLAANFFEGAQMFEVSTAHTFQTHAFFDPDQLSVSTREYVNGSPYYNWQTISLRGFSDNRYLLQIMQRLEAEGWELTHTDFAHTPPNFGYGISTSRTILYHFAQPARTISVLKTVQGRVDDEPTEYRIRILQQGQTQWLELDQDAGNRSWQNLLTTNSLVPQLREDQLPGFVIRFQGQFLEIKIPLETGGGASQMTYRFGLQNGQFILTEVIKVMGEPCGELEQAYYRPLVGNFEIRSGEETCSLSGGSQQTFAAPRINTTAARRRVLLSLGNLQMGQNRVRISGNRGDFIF